MQRIPPELTTLARRLRRDATEAERRLWLRLRAYRPRFTRQLVIGHFIVDLACRDAGIAVELDGGHHADPKHIEADAVRTRYLEANGWTVLRFWNSEVITDADSVAAVILEAVSRVATHPQPLPSREGRR